MNRQYEPETENSRKATLPFFGSVLLTDTRTNGYKKENVPANNGKNENKKKQYRRLLYGMS